jgi:hypothetical protein
LKVILFIIFILYVTNIIDFILPKSPVEEIYNLFVEEGALDYLQSSFVETQTVSMAKTTIKHAAQFFDWCITKSKKASPSQNSFQFIDFQTIIEEKPDELVNYVKYIEGVKQFSYSTIKNRILSIKKVVKWFYYYSGKKTSAQDISAFHEVVKDVSKGLQRKLKSFNSDQDLNTIVKNRRFPKDGLKSLVTVLLDDIKDTLPKLEDEDYVKDMGLGLGFFSP